MPQERINAVFRQLKHSVLSPNSQKLSRQRRPQYTHLIPSGRDRMITEERVGIITLSALTQLYDTAQFDCLIASRVAGGSS
jgi:hypothetical protein